MSNQPAGKEMKFLQVKIADLPGGNTPTVEKCEHVEAYGHPQAQFPIGIQRSVNLCEGCTDRLVGAVIRHLIETLPLNQMVVEHLLKTRGE